MEEYDNNFIVLTDEDGNETEFEHIGTLEHNGETYLAFIPAELNLEEEAEVVILKTEEEDGEDILVSVEDEAEAEEVYQLFMEELEDQYDFEGEE